MSRASSVVLVSVLSAFAASVNGQSSDFAWADRFFPEKLANDSNVDFVSGGYPVRRFIATASAGDVLFAAYSNGYIGAVRVLKHQGDTVNLLAESAPNNMSGKSPEVSLMDLDADGSPEVLASFADQHGVATFWIYRWDGRSLSLMGDTEDNAITGVASDITNPSFLDVDGDGRIEIISHGVRRLEGEDEDGYPSVEPVITLFEIKSGEIVRSADDIALVEQFTRGRGSPIRQNRQFPARDGNAKYAMRIVATQKHQVQAATIWLNGTPIFTPNDFKTGAVVLGPRGIAPVAGRANDLSVELQGEPGNGVVVIVQRLR